MSLSKEAREYFAKAGRKGAKLRQQKVSPEERKKIARGAAKARWTKEKAAAAERTRRAKEKKKTADP
jgi:hypothetical protein